MTFLLNLIPARYRVLAEILIIAAIAAAIWGWIEFGKHQAHEAGLTEGRAEVQARWNEQQRAQLAAAVAESQVNAKETQRRLDRQKEAQDAHDQELAQAQLDAASAVTAADRVRRRAAQLAAAACRPVGDPGTGIDSQAARAAPGVLADVLGKVVDRSRLLAAYAGAARRAGLQCERDYDALRALKR